MEWRCEWCGKPHESDDPPCDNCGHSSFERAVVPAKDISEGQQEAAIVWECTACGREHPKHSPPCSRCGNSTLEKSRLELDDDELTSPGYLDLVTPRYVVAAVVTLLVAGFVLFGLIGTSALPGLGDSTPGDPDELDGMALGPAEDQFLDAFNDHRAEADSTALDRDDELDDIATTLNRGQVELLYEDEPFEPGMTVARLRDTCGASPTTEAFAVEPDTIDGDVAGAMIDARADEDGLVTATGDQFGIDTHAGPDDRLIATVIVC